MILAALLLCLIGAGCEQAVATDRIVVTHIEGVAKDAIGRLTPQPKIPDALPAPHPKPSVTDWLGSILPDAKLPTPEQVAEIAEKVKPAESEGCECGCGQAGCKCGKACAPDAGPESAQVDTESPADNLYFGAEWCGPCRETRPIVESLQEDGLRVEIIDADAHPDLAAKYRIGSLPTLIKLLPDGRFRSLPGRQSRDSIVRFYGFTPPQSDPPASAAVSSALTATPRVYACGYRGSGTVIDRGCLLTCAHVVIDELTGEYRSPIRLMFGEKLVPAKVVGHVFMESGEDLALLEFDAETQVIEVADSVADLNAAVTSHGYPRGEPQILERRLNLWNARRGANGQPEYAMGAYRFASQQFIGGESGGGVTDASGKLVGVISAKDGRNGIVVSLDAIKAFLGDSRGGE